MLHVLFLEFVDRSLVNPPVESLQSLYSQPVHTRYPFPHELVSVQFLGEGHVQVLHHGFHGTPVFLLFSRTG